MCTQYIRECWTREAHTHTHTHTGYAIVKWLKDTFYGIFWELICLVLSSFSSKPKKIHNFVSTVTQLNFVSHVIRLYGFVLKNHCTSSPLCWGRGCEFACKVGGNNFENNILFWLLTVRATRVCVLYHVFLMFVNIKSSMAMCTYAYFYPTKPCEIYILAASKPLFYIFMSKWGVCNWPIVRPL